jgi:hypothetical protein
MPPDAGFPRAPAAGLPGGRPARPHVRVASRGPQARARIGAGRAAPDTAPRSGCAAGMWGRRAGPHGRAALALTRRRHAASALP